MSGVYPLSFPLSTSSRAPASCARQSTGERLPAEDAEIAFDATLEKYKEAASRKQGVDAPGDPKVTTDQLRVVRLANKVVAKGDVFLLSEARSLYLREIAKRVRKQTLREKERILATFAGWLGPDVEVTAVSKAEAGRYVSEVLTQRDYAVKTVRDTIGHLSAFFAWLEGRGRIEFNPWRGVAGTVRDTTRGTKPKRRPWTDAELHKLLEGILETDPLWPMVAIAAYSGMRREEIASLKVGDVTEKAFNVTEGKPRRLFAQFQCILCWLIWSHG